MSNINMIVPYRESDLGDGFKVKRILPYAKKRMVGPFIFLDHMGPVELKTGFELKVRAHPHIGLSTLTYLYSGGIMHRDTLGFEQKIVPEEVNWMTAGDGIAHSERSYPIEKDSHLEGLQMWVALPKNLEDIKPSFVHLTREQIPSIEIGKSEYKLIAGSAFNKKSPVPVYSPLFCISGKVKPNDLFQMKLSPQEEGGIYLVSGKLEIEGQQYDRGSFICFTQGTAIDFKALEESNIMIVGGEVFPEKRFIFWNFVSSSAEKIEMAKERWKKMLFGQVKNESEFTPLPPDDRKQL